MNDADLDTVFGSGSGTATERALASDRLFIRSQVQIAVYRGAGTGRILSAIQALNAFGFEALLIASKEGAFPLIWKKDEPAATLKQRRVRLGISSDRLERAAGIQKGWVDKAETPGQVVPIRILEIIAQYLALDDSMIGYSPDAGGDNQLGVRLRQLKDARDEFRFSENIVIKLCEAAWVIQKQHHLTRLIGETAFQGHKADTNFSYPAWKQGFRLAAQTRRELNIAENAPIPSVRKLLEVELKIPFVQQDLGQRFAGATLANGTVRGIVVNDQGANSNVWVRRMTLCHELGHLLWDPDQQLNKLKVDTYDEMQGRKILSDPVEIRANAFAIAFLAPPAAVLEEFNASKTDEEALFAIAEKFGISVTAARYHAKNILSREIEHPHQDFPAASAEWEAAENLTIDFFPIASTPITRRGHFARIVAEACRAKALTVDSAAALMAATSTEIETHLDAILDVVA